MHCCCQLLLTVFSPSQKACFWKIFGLGKHVYFIVSVPLLMHKESLLLMCPDSLLQDSAHTLTPPRSLSSTCTWKWGLLHRYLRLDLVNSGCCNELPSSGWLVTNRNLFLTFLEAGSLRSGFQHVEVLVKTLFQVSSYGRERASGFSEVSFERSPFTRAPPSRLNHLPKSLPPKMPSWWGLGSQHTNFVGDTNTHPFVLLSSGTHHILCSSWKKIYIYILSPLLDYVIPYICETQNGSF